MLKMFFLFGLTVCLSGCVKTQCKRNGLSAGICAYNEGDYARAQSILKSAAEDAHAKEISAHRVYESAIKTMKDIAAHHPPVAASDRVIESR